MKAILVHTATATDKGAYADGGSVLTVPDDVGAERAVGFRPAAGIALGVC